MTVGPTFGGIEAGGSKFLCAVGSGPDELSERIRIPTSTPEETIARAVEFFRPYTQSGRLAAIGIASFGPVDVDATSGTFGYITSTPKPGWADTDLRGPVEKGLEIPVAFDTDVNGSALGEHRWGAAMGLDSFIYLTVGTGIGGGAMVERRLVHGLTHPEMGHIRIPHDREADPFEGACPYHGDCLEGLAAGPAIRERWGVPPEELPVHHPAWALEASYLGLAVASLICTLSPERVIIGGGIMEQLHLLPALRLRVQELLGGYVQSPLVLDEIDRFIVPPALGRLSGVLSAMAMARDLLNS